MHAVLTPNFCIFGIFVQRSAIPTNDLELGNAQTIPILGSPLGAPSGLAYDWKARQLYWTDTLQNTLSVVTSDGNFRKTLISGDAMFKPTSVVVDSEIGNAVKQCSSLREVAVDIVHVSTVITDHAEYVHVHVCICVFANIFFNSFTNFYILT